MKVDWFANLFLLIIAATLFAIFAEQPSRGLAAAPAPISPDAGLPFRDVDFVSQGSNGFIAVNRRTGEFSFYQLQAPNNQWKWEKTGPTGNLAELGTSPTTVP